MRRFCRLNGYTLSKLLTLYTKIVIFSIYGGYLPMAKNENSNFSYMSRRIGSTTYKVKVVFNENCTETMEEKILRLIRNEVVTTAGTYLTVTKTTAYLQIAVKGVPVVVEIPLAAYLFQNILCRRYAAERKLYEFYEQQHQSHHHRYRPRLRQH